MHRLFALNLTIVLLASATLAGAEPRWLLRALPGAYPGVVYFLPTNMRAIALTIDDGVDPQTTPAILDELKSIGATATFFLLSDSISGNESLVQRIVNEGHEIGHHMTRDEISVFLADDELKQKFGEAADKLEAYGPVSWFRPGSGVYDSRMRALSDARGYRIALASVAPVDTLLADPESMAKLIDWSIEPGSIVVLHDVGARGRRTVRTLRILLPRLRERGFRVMSLSKLDAKVMPSGGPEVSPRNSPGSEQ